MMMTLAVIALAVAAPAHGKGDVQFVGLYVEGCSCAPPCPCELTGVAMGCQGVGGFEIRKGTFEGKDISGIRVAYATAPGDWVACYVDAPTPAKRKAGDAFATAAFTAWGKLAPMQHGKIMISVVRGKGMLSVNDGKVMSLTTAPILGGDKKTAMKFSNINSVLHPIVMQGKVVKGNYNDLGHEFELKGSNAYFNPTVIAKGKL